MIAALGLALPFCTYEHGILLLHQLPQSGPIQNITTLINVIAEGLRHIAPSRAYPRAFEARKEVMGGVVFAHYRPLSQHISVLCK